MDRRDFLRTLGLGAAAFAAPRLAAAPTSKPNILFIMADDLGPEWLSCYGGEGIQTPHLDGLAKGGVRFTHTCYSMPKCTPTRVTLLTGQYPFRHGWVNHWDVPRWGAGCHFDPKHNTTFARILKTAGYTTAAAGKWQINDFRVQPDAMERHGFDDWCMWTGFESGNPPSGKRYWDPYIHTRAGSKTYADRFGADVFVDFLINFMKRNAAKPMMLYFPMCLPHGPLVPTPLERDAKGKNCHKAMVRYIDHCVGRLAQAIDDMKLRDRTIIIFTTDNGSGGGITGKMNGRVVRGGKGNMTETGAREPFIVNCPGLVPAGVETDALMDFTDLLPTFAELGGAEVPKNLVVDGKSFAKVILGKATDSDRTWILAMGGGVARLTEKGVVPVAEYNDRVVRGKRFKLWVEKGKSTKLFDLTADPAEQKNLIGSADPAAAAAQKKLEAVIASLPEKDGVPRYDPTPPQPWDRKIGASKKKKQKKPRKKAKKE